MKKVLFIGLLIIVIVLNVNIVYATQIPDTPSSVSEWEYYVMYQGIDGEIYLVVTDEKVTVTTDNEKLVLN